jgi:O-antigen/teichoic acid export membrane protein
LRFPDFSQFVQAAKRLLRARFELSWVLTGQLLVFIGGFASIKVLTAAMQPEAFGRFALGISIAGLCNVFVYGPLGQVALRYFPICRERGELPAYFRLLNRTYAAATLALVILACLAAASTGAWFGREWALIVLASLFFGLTSGLSSYLTALQSALRQRRVVALYQALDAWLKPLSAAALLLAFSGTAYWALLGYLLATLSVTALQARTALMTAELAGIRGPASTPDAHPRRLFGEFAAYASPFVAFSLFAAISSYADRWILLAISGERNVGIYSAMYQIANVPSVVIVGIITQFMTPIIFERAGAAASPERTLSSDRLLAAAVALTSVVLAAVIVFAYFFGEALLVFFTTPLFAAYHDLLWLIMASLAVFHIAQMLTLKGLYNNRPSLYIWPKAAQALCLFVAGIALTRSYGVYGLALSLNVSAVLYLIMVHRANRALLAPALKAQ